MALTDEFLTQQPELTAPVAGDFFHIIDVSDTVASPDGTSKKILFSNIGPITFTVVINNGTPGIIDITPILTVGTLNYKIFYDTNVSLLGVENLSPATVLDVGFSAKYIKDDMADINFAPNDPGASGAVTLVIPGVSSQYLTFLGVDDPAVSFTDVSDMVNYYFINPVQSGSTEGQSFSLTAYKAPLGVVVMGRHTDVNF